VLRLLHLELRHRRVHRRLRLAKPQLHRLHLQSILMTLICNSSFDRIF